MSYNLQQLQNLLRQVGWPENQIAKAAAIAEYESSGDASIINNGSATHTNEYSVGLFQINTLAHKGYTIQQLQNPVTNAAIALQLWSARPNYSDWYNSNIKYANNYKGTAAQSRAIYSSGSSGEIEPIFVADMNETPITTGSDNPKIDATALVASVSPYSLLFGALVIGIIIRNRV